MSDATITKSKVFKEDLAIATGGTGVEETGTRLTSVGGVVTLTKLDLGHIPYRTFAGTPEDLLDGGQDVDILPKDIDAGGNVNVDGTLTVGGATTLSNLTPAGYVKNSAAGLLSTGAILAADLPTLINATKIGDGSVSNTEFQYINSLASNVQDQINTIIAGAAVQPSFALLQNRQAQGTNGGTATTGSWLIVPLNVEQEDADSIVDSTALPAFTLATGTYRIDAYIPFFQTNGSVARLYNVTDAAVTVIGSACYSTSSAQTHSQIVGTFTIAAGKQFRIEYNVAQTKADSGLGLAHNLATEIYAQVQITKIA